MILVTNLDIVSLCESCLRNTNSVEPINFITIQFNIIIIMIEAHKYVIYIMLYVDSRTIIEKVILCLFI